VDDVVVPGGVIGAEIDAAVADVGVALGVHRPRGRVHVDAAAGDPLGVLRDDVVALRGTERNPDGARVHLDASIFFQNAVAADRCGAAGFAHRSGHYPRDLPVNGDGERVRGDAGDADHRGAGGVVCLEASQRHSDVAVRGPEFGRLPLQRIVIEPFDFHLGRCRLRRRGPLGLAVAQTARRGDGELREA